jgi:hypothetical protein
MNDLEFKIIYTCDKEDLLKIEQVFLDKLLPYFNVLLDSTSRLGIMHSEETKLKISNSKKGKHFGNTRKRTEEEKEHMRLINLGKKQSKETILKHKEYRPTQETIVKMRNSMIGKNLGKKRTEESKLKMRLSHLGIKTGTRIKKKKIMTKEEWERRSMAAKKRWDKIKRNGGNRL